jgi:hypothetical protein
MLLKTRFTVSSTYVAFYALQQRVCDIIIAPPPQLLCYCYTIFNVIFDYGQDE